MTEALAVPRLFDDDQLNQQVARIRAKRKARLGQAAATAQVQHAQTSLAAPDGIASSRPSLGLDDDQMRSAVSLLRSLSQDTAFDRTMLAETLERVRASRQLRLSGLGFLDHGETAGGATRRAAAPPAAASSPAAASYPAAGVAATPAAATASNPRATPSTRHHHHAAQDPRPRAASLPASPVLPARRRASVPLRQEPTAPPPPPPLSRMEQLRAASQANLLRMTSSALAQHRGFVSEANRSVSMLSRSRSYTYSAGASAVASSLRVTRAAAVPSAEYALTSRSLGSPAPRTTLPSSRSSTYAALASPAPRSSSSEASWPSTPLTATLSPRLQPLLSEDARLTHVLRQGAVLLKAAAAGPPRPMFFALNDTMDRLCWSKPGTADVLASVALRHITAVRHAQPSPALRQYFQSGSVYDRAFSLETRQRTIELLAGDEKQRQDWVVGLVLVHSKQLPRRR